MRYFLVERDEKIVDYPLPIDFSSVIDPRHLNHTDEWRLPNRIGLNLTNNEFVVFPDIYLSELFLCNNEVKSTVSLFEPKLTYKQIIMINRNRKQLMLYYLPIVSEICVRSYETVGATENFVSIQSDAIKKALHNESIFRLTGINSPTYILRQDLVENLLSRCHNGFVAKMITL